MSLAPVPTILHLDSSPLGAGSVSRELTAAVAAAIRDAAPAARTVYRDLVADPIGHLDANTLAAIRPAPGAQPPTDDGFRREAEMTERVLREFLDADVIVVGAPMYNFSVPSQLKAWIDRIAQAGRTFRYTAQGPEGLAGDKRVVVVSSRGGQYAGQAFEAAMDHQEAYLRAVFGFLGIRDLTVLRAEGIALGAEPRAAAIGAARAEGRAVATRLGSALAANDTKAVAQAA